MYTNRFQQGDKVSYCGGKLSQLGGKLGVVLARVHNVATEVVVDFGDGAYVMDETSDLTKFQGKEPPPRGSERHSKGDKGEKKVTGPEVQSRRGVSKADSE